MDEFGVLTERYGIKQQGKSAPMAASKRPQTQTTTASSFGQSRNWSSNSMNGSFTDNHDFLFPSKKTQSFDDSNDIFGDFLQKTTKQNGKTGNGFDDPIFASSSSKNFYQNGGDDDIFGFKSSNVNSFNNDDIFGSFNQTSSPQVDDLFGDFGSKSKIPSQNGSAGFDDLIPGFGSTVNGRKAETVKSSFISADDPFDILKSTSTSANTSFVDPLEEISKLSGPKRPSTTPTLRPPPKPAQVVKADKVKSSSASSMDGLDDFAMGRVRSNSDGHSMKRQVNTKAGRYKEAENAPFEPQNKSHSADDLESFFAMSSRSSSAPRSRDANLDSVFGEKKNDRKGPQVINKATSGPTHGVRKTTPSINMVDDLSSIFGGASMFGEFEEVEGESEERRKARLGRQQRTHHRVAQAVADMNQRERQTQQEQEERQRIADAMDLQIKRWSAGKEGNMRALLSSLQQVLWPECGWEPVSLTDLITSTSVKKVYRKATLYVHPDKVQQKGATLQQKYIAEKVFDLLKEAWNKFNAEELR